MFDTLQDRLAATFKNLRGKGRLSEADIDATAREIRVALLEADVNLSVVKDFIAAIKERARGTELTGALNPAQQVIKIVNEELVSILGGETRLLRFAKRPPTVIMLAGLQGSGKTTLAAKLGLWLKDQGHSPLLVAADLQRPNAVNQLQVIIDTAGRLGIDAEMMKQAVDNRDAVGPDEVLFIVDAMIGQDAVNTANAFADGVGFDGVALTKLDGDARGGAALSIARVTGKPIMFASNGEALADFDVFHPDRMASRILGMGDMLTLIEQAEKTFDAEQSAKAAAKLAGQGGEFGLADFLQQMQMVRKMGPLSKVFGMLPGMGELKDRIAGIDERDVDHIEAIIHSMTPTERDNPKIIDGSRRARIARGAGVEVSEVNGLINRFFEARKMMTSLATGTMPGIPGIAGLPGPRRQPARSQKKKGGRGVSGNPAKRNAAQHPAAPVDPATTAFGGGELDQAALEKAMSDFQLPPDLRSRFGK